MLLREKRLSHDRLIQYHAWLFMRNLVPDIPDLARLRFCDLQKYSHICKVQFQAELNTQSKVLDIELEYIKPFDAEMRDMLLWLVSPTIMRIKTTDPELKKLLEVTYPDVNVILESEH